MIKYLGLLVLIPCLTLAGVIPERTRIIYDSKNVSQSYVMKNTNQYPVIVQFWVDNGDPNKNPDTTPSPFVVTPVMVRMDPSVINSIRIIYSGEGGELSTDNESLFFLNILEIPPMSRDSRIKNEVALSMQTQIKLIYRPDSIKLGEQELVSKLKALRFSYKKNSDGIVQLTVENPTPYVANFSSFQLVGTEAGKVVNFAPLDSSNLTVLPKSKRTFPIYIGKKDIQIQSLDYWIIDDLGKYGQSNSNLLMTKN